MTNEQAKAGLMVIYGVVAPSVQMAIDTAIKALDKKPEMDCIRRAELKNWIEGFENRERYYHPRAKLINVPTGELWEMADELPAVSPMIVKHEFPEWIPIDYKEPETRGEYLATYNSKATGATYIGILIFDGEDWYEDHFVVDVLAWMELPEMWKGE